jgi:hypothetical protein
MPYIKPVDRESLDRGIRQPLNAGELNYAFTKLMIQYRNTYGDSYQIFNDIIGAIDNAKAEFRRRVVDPYEDNKIEQNGDVY